MKYCVIYYRLIYPHNTADYQVDWYKTADDAKRSAKYVTKHEPGYRAQVMEMLTEFDRGGKEVRQ